jgi:HAD superfamily hydrolase (TIGR01509 family)
MYELVIFDFDDTILHLGVDWPAVRREVVSLARSRGKGFDDKLHLVPLGNILSEDPAMKGSIDSIYLRFEMDCARRKAYTLFADMPALVRELRKDGRKLAICSGNHSISIGAILEETGLGGEFDFVCGRDKTSRGKPSPEPLLLIMERLGAKKEKTIFVGDSINDGGAAEAAGIAYFPVRPDSGEDVGRLRSLLISSR